MVDKLEIVITGDAQQLIDALKSSGVQLKTFSNEADKGGQGAAKLGSGVKALALEMGLMYGLNEVVGMVKDFGVQSWEASRSNKDAEGALTKLLGSTEAYNKAMKEAQAVTGGTISKTDQARAIFGLLDNGIAKTAEEAAQYVKAGRALNAALGETASFEKFLMLLDEGSDMLLNNFNITKSMVNAKKAEIEATTNLSGEEARLAAVRQLLLEKGLAMADTVSSETEGANKLSAAWADFQVAFGGLMQSIGLGTEDLTKFVRELEKGAQSWTWMISVMTGADVSNNTVRESTDAAREAEERRAAAVKKSEDELKKQQETMLNISVAQASYYNQAEELRLKDLDDQQKYLDALDKAKQERDAAEIKSAQDLSQERDRLRNEEESKRQEIMKLAGDVDAAFIQQQLDQNTKFFDDKRAILETKNAEEQAAIRENERVKMQEAADARNKEREEYKKHLEELKLKTALAILEQNGQLDQMLGLTGVKAADAFELVTSGVVKIDEKMKGALAGAFQKFEGSTGQVTAAAKSNMAIIQEVSSGNYKAVSDSTDKIDESAKKQVQIYDTVSGKYVDVATKSAESAGKIGDAHASIDSTFSKTEMLHDAMTSAIVGNYDKIYNAAIHAASAPKPGGVPGFAAGGDFIVPPGFPNDSFKMGVSSGERVIVQPNYINQYNLTTQTPMSSAGVERDFKFMQLFG